MKSNSARVGFILNDPLFADKFISEPIIRLIGITIAGDKDNTLLPLNLVY